MWFHGDGKGRRILGNLQSWRVVTAYRLSHNRPFFNRFKNTRTSSKPLPFGDEAPYFLSLDETGLPLTIAIGVESVSGAANVIETGIALTIATGSEEINISQEIVETGIPLAIAVGNESVIAIRNISITATGNALTVNAGSETVLFDYSLTETGIPLTISTGAETVSSESNITETGISLIVATNNVVVTAEGGVVHATINATGIAITISINSASIEAISRAAGAIQSGKGKKVKLPPYPQWYPMKEPKPLRQDIRLRMDSAGDLWIQPGIASIQAIQNRTLRPRGNKTELRTNNVFMITSKNDSDRYWQHRRRLEEEEIMRFLLAA